MAGKSIATSIGTVNERRLRPVYDHLDNGNNKSALHEADKVLKKQRDLTAAKVLKTIALHRLGRTDEAFQLSQEVALTTPVDENSLQGLTLYYRETQRIDLIPPLYENAVSKCPGNEEYLTHLFMSYVRAGKPKDMQRVAINLFKHHPNNPYLFWGVMAIVMQAIENEKLGKAMLLPLAEKMIEKRKLEAEAETRLYLIVLDKLGKYEKAITVLEIEAKRDFTINKDSIRGMTSEFNKKLGKWAEVNSCAKKSLTKNPDVWNHTLDYLDSLERLIESEWTPDGSSDEVDFGWGSAVELFVEIKNREVAENSDRPRRGPHLAVLELAWRKAKYAADDHSDRLGSMETLIFEYVRVFCSKACCFNDVKKYVDSISHEKKTEMLEKINGLVSTEFCNKENASNGDVDDKTKEKEIVSHLTYVKLQRYLGHHESMTRNEKLHTVNELLERYEDGLRYSDYRPSTDLRAVDDYCLIASNLLYDLYLEEGDKEFAWRSIYLLELGKNKSQSNFKFKFLLIRLYCDFGIFLPCAQIYDSLEIKHVQQDSLGYLVFNSVSELGHYQLASQAFEASRAYFLSNEKDSLEFLIACFKNGTFHKIPEFVSFRDRVKRSIQATQTVMEHTYMDLVTQAEIETPLSDLLSASCLTPEMTNYEQLADNRDFTLTFDWSSDQGTPAEDRIRKSFESEKIWLRFRELQVRTIVQLLTKQNADEISCLLRDLDESTSRHGPPRSRITSAQENEYPSLVCRILRLFEKILNENLETDWEATSKSVISELLESLPKESNGDGPVKDNLSADVPSCVMSQESLKNAMTLPVPDSLKSLDRRNLERLVSVSEVFSLSVLLSCTFKSNIEKIKSDALKRRRKKKGSQEPMPSVIRRYQDFVRELKDFGAKLKSSLDEARSNALAMNFALLEPTEKSGLTNGVVDDVSSQIVKLASGSLLNSIQQLCGIVDGRVKNLKMMNV